MRLPLLLAALALLPAGAGVAPNVATAQDVPEGLVMHYTCDGGAHLAAAYLNAPDGTSFAVVVFDGKMTPMKAGPTGSGVRYVSLTAPALVWHTKGDGGFLAHDDARETMIAANCKGR